MADSMLIAISVMLYGTAFVLGFLVGRSNASPIASSLEKGSFLKSTSTKAKTAVQIDEKRFVTSISTDSLEKKGKDLGTQTVVNDSVDSAVSKLAMLKKK